MWKPKSIIIRVDETKTNKIMKKLLFACLLIGAVNFVQAQDQRVRTTTEMQSLGYNIGEAVYLGNINGVDIYRASFYGGSKYMTTKKRCKSGVGCCKSGYVDFDEYESIHIVDAKVGDRCGVGDHKRGQMYYNEEETWIVEQ